MDGLLLAPAILLIAGAALWTADAAPPHLVWPAVCAGSLVSLVAHWRMSRGNR